MVASFAPTTPVSIAVGNPTSGVDFGFVPVATDIVADLADGTLLSTGKTLEYWVKVFRKAIIAENSGRIAHGHDGDGGQGGGWGHSENYENPDELRALVAEIAGLYFPEPYQFTPGSELDEVFAALRARPATDDERLFQELLVTELNFVAGRGLIGETDRLGVLIGWGETLLNTAPTAKSADKSRNGDLISAIQIFQAVNTGGGGGVDE